LLVTLRRTAALGVLLGCLPLVATAPASAGGVPDCTETTDNEAAQVSHQVSRPLDLLGIQAAQRLVARPGQLPGTGVNVAVLDSGVAPRGQIPVIAAHSVQGSSVKPVFYHGTAVAGLVAGRTRPGGLLTGISPGSGIVDVQVYGWPHGAAGTPTRPDTEGLVQGLRWLAPRARSLHVRVAVAPLAVPQTRALAAAVRALQAQGVLVIAPSGNRPSDAGPGYLSEFFTARPGQDGFSQIAPAREPGVLTAGTTGPGPGLTENPASIPNHALDVLVPTEGGVTTALNGGSCLLSTAETSWAAAEVGGIAALLFDRYAGESPAQIEARIVDTASGTSPEGHGRAVTGDASLSFGAGVVQPVDALTRPLIPTHGGSFRTLLAQPERTPPVRAPLPATDTLRHSRHLAIWAGLVGGAVVVVASILRPLLSRRTRRSD
jgi:membrane-anchored mycosin MYCP